MGSQLYMFYDPPLHLVRGEGVWLYDAKGRAYLDVYNNVPHVGHCHPHVVEAIARQAARLNTNTRYLYDEVLDYAERLTATLPAGLDVCGVRQFRQRGGRSRLAHGQGPYRPARRHRHGRGLSRLDRCGGSAVAGGQGRRARWRPMCGC